MAVAIAWDAFSDGSNSLLRLAMASTIHHLGLSLLPSTTIAIASYSNTPFAPINLAHGVLATARRFAESRPSYNSLGETAACGTSSLRSNRYLRCPFTLDSASSLRSRSLHFPLPAPTIPFHDPSHQFFGDPKAVPVKDKSKQSAE